MARRQGARPVVAARDVEEQAVVVAQLDQPVEAVDHLAGVLALGDHARFGVRKVVDAFREQIFGRGGHHAGLLVHAVAAEAGVDVELAQGAFVSQQEVVVHLGVLDILLPVVAVQVRQRAEGLAARAELAVHVESRAEHQFQPLVDVERGADVAVDAVAVHRVELLVGLRIGVVREVVQGVRIDDAGRRVAGERLPVFLFVPAYVEVVAAPEQRVGGRRGAVTDHRQVVAVLAVVVDFSGQLHETELLGEGDRETLRLVARVGDDPGVAHVGERNADRAAPAVVARDRNRILVGGARLEETLVPVARPEVERGVHARLRVVRRPLVEFLPFVARSPRVAAVSARGGLAGGRLLGLHGVERVGARAVVARAVFVLEVGPVAGALEREVRTERDAESLGRPAGLGGDDDGAVRCARPVEGRGCGAFEHRDVVDVLGIEVGGPVAVVDARVGVVVRRPAHGRHAARHGHAVDHEQRRVVVHVDGRFAAQRDAQRSAGTGRGVVEVKACHLARKGVEPVVRNGGRQVLVVHFRHGISQRLLFAGHTQRRDHDAFDRLGFRLHRHVETGLPSPDTLRCLLVAQVGEGQLLALFGADAVLTVRTGNGSPGGSAPDDYRHTDERGFPVSVEHGSLYRTFLGCGCERQPEKTGQEGRCS